MSFGNSALEKSVSKDVKEKGFQRYILSEVTRDVDGTSLLEGWESVNGLQGRAVGNEETTTHGLQLWHRDFGEVSISNERNITADLGQVWCHDALHVRSVNTEGGLDLLEGWDSKAGDVADSHVGGEGQVWELEGQVKTIVVDDQLLGNVGDLGVDVAKVGVVGDLKTLDLLQVDTVERGKVGIGDEDLVGLRDWAVEVQGIKRWEGGPLDSIDLLEGWERESGEEGESGQSHGHGDGGEGLRLKGDELSAALGDQVSVNLANAVKVDNTTGILVDDNVSLEFLAGRSDGGGITLVLDLNRLLVTDLVGGLGC